MKKDHFPDILFLMETKNSQDFVYKVFCWLGYDFIHTVEPEGRSGGLAIFWKSHLEIEFLYADKNLMDLQVSSRNKVWFISCVYGLPVTHMRPKLWEHLNSIGLKRAEAWCLIGDFNDIRSNDEKLGGPRRSPSSFQCFEHMLLNCSMHELGSTGNSFTWGGNRNDQWVQCKLDRCFGNPAWFSIFPNAHQWFLEKFGSDHRPVLVKFTNDNELFRGQFRYDKRLDDDPYCIEVIHRSWNSAMSQGTHSSFFSLIECRRAISVWKHSSDTNAQSRIKRLRKDLDAEKSIQIPCWPRIEYIKDQLSLAYGDEELFWRQKSRQKWLAGGDKNTGFFHATVHSERLKNELSFLLDENDQEFTRNSDKGKIASSFFENLFTSTYILTHNNHLEGLQAKVTSEMNHNLIQEVTELEVYNEVFSINKESAPGPDGFTALFFQQHWDLVKHQILTEIFGFFETGVLPQDWNHTHICLIPKITSPQRMSDLRPISLCSVLYKIISKILTQRLKKHLPAIVSTTQSAFVPQRLISDNILVAHEMIHSLRTNDRISKEHMAFKTDMSKAYDRVEWPFLETMMTALGFNNKWISWIMNCVTSVSYSVLINGQPYGHIIPTRGIRQGDPLSPALFVLCTEALIHILNKAEQAGKITGIQFQDKKVSVNHLLFADDTLLMCKATKQECEELMQCLSQYGQLSGQMINLNKSAITFGKNVDIQIKDWIKSRSGISLEGGTGKYLGLPECLSGSKRDLFGFIKEKLQSRLTGWYAKTLSQGGKEVLLKSIALALPVYVMSCFKLPKNLCQKLTTVMMDFWWNSMQQKRKIHWLSWQRLTLPKDQGGFGFKDLQCFNQALLAKQAWRVLQEKGSLFSRVFQSRYFSNSDFLSATRGSRPSYAWRSILFGRELLMQGLRTVIGNGQKTFVWTDKWLHDGSNRRPLNRRRFINVDLKVSQLIDPTSRNWNLNMLRDLFPWKDVEIILKQRPLFFKEDSFCWLHSHNGLYSVKTGYEFLSKQVHHRLYQEAKVKPSVNSLFDKIWNLHTAPKIRIFLWKALHGAIPVEDRLRTRGIRSDDGCLMCDTENETINHILFECPLARQVWAITHLSSAGSEFSNSVYTNMSRLIDLTQQNDLPHHLRFVSPWILWFLWKNRNALLFEGKGSITTTLVDKAYEAYHEWFSAQTHMQNDEKHLKITKWCPPLPGELKCNIGFAWSKQHHFSGASWVVRDSQGKVLLHSRRSFNEVHSPYSAKIRSWEWALESMTHHHFDRVIFASSTHEIIQALHKPHEWPLLLGDISELLSFTKDKPHWFLCMEPFCCNRGANAIATSVITGCRFQSYVARGYPSWMTNVFTAERGNLI